MNQENVVLCASSFYEQKFYFNEAFAGLPDAVKDELKIMSVLYTEDVGGSLSLEFEEDGTLVFNVTYDEGDLLYDDIGSILKVKELQREKADFLESLELYYRAFFLNEEVNALLEDGEE